MKNLITFIFFVLFSPAALACFVPDGSYEKANNNLWMVSLMVLFALSYFSFKAPKYWFRATSVTIGVLFIPVGFYLVEYFSCCDCGHGALLASKLVIGSSLILCALSVVGVKAHAKT
jgi:hypothetical protein